MSTSVSPSENKTYGVAPVCRIWKLSRATLYRQRVRARATRPEGGRYEYIHSNHIKMAGLQWGAITSARTPAQWRRG